MPKTSIKALFETNKTSPEGLSKQEAKKRLKEYGRNVLKVKKEKPIWMHFVEEFRDLMVIILIIAAGISFISGEKKDAIVIFAIVILNAIIGFIQKYRAEKAISALKKLMAPMATVIRNGETMRIKAKLLVPGDILILAEGDFIAADAILFEANELKTSEATLTGESTPVQKTIETPSKKSPHLAERHNQIFMGTLVAHGSGRAIVIHTGMRTEFGKIAKLTSETEKEKSPLQKELFRIGVFVGKVTLIISAILFFVGVFWQGSTIAKSILFASAVAVAAVPEGLPATVTIALAMGVQRMARKNAIIKQLASVETLGSTTVICSDKTGTLTKNEMTVKEIIMGEYKATVTGVGYKPNGIIELKKGKMTLAISQNHNHYSQTQDISQIKKSHPDIFEMLQKIHSISILCNNSILKKSTNNKWEILGDPTEGALLTLGTKISHSPKELKKLHERLAELPFDSNRKRMTVIARDLSAKKIVAYTKGAPDSILDICSHVFYGEKVVPLTAKIKKEILLRNEEMAGKALRTIAMATKNLKGTPKNKYSASEVEKDLTFYGIVGMIDPPRPEVKEAVQSAREAGIKVYIITGDHGLTAAAISRQIGLIDDKTENLIITGTELNKIPDAKLKNLLQKKHDLNIIFARVNPEHKLRIVNLLKERNEIVAVTGDGVNDAPALKKADIGIAMGITGTDVSKEAANMVLADDSFSTIVNAIKEGRTIYENLKKFVFYIFSCNIGELFTIFTAIILGLPAPLTAILILAVDIGTDILPALALGIDPPEAGIMKKPPRDPHKKIMEKGFNLRFIYLGMVIGSIVVLIYLHSLYSYGWTWGEAIQQDSIIYLKSSTMAFVALVFIQMINSFNSRSAETSILKIGFFSNLYLLGAISISILSTIAFTEVSFLQDWLHTTSLNLSEWGIIALASLSVLAIEEIRKLLMNLKKKVNI